MLNQAPAANAGLDQTVECQCTTTTGILDGTASSDLDGDTLNYEWHEGTTLLGTGATLNVDLSHNSHPITLTVTDPSGASSQDNVLINVVDTMPPTVTPPPAISSSTGSGAIGCALMIGDATLGTATANDICSGTVAVTRGGIPSGNFFPVGTTTITYTATDSSGNSATATQLVTVLDNTPPTLGAYQSAKVTTSGNTIVTPNVAPTDNCSIKSVTAAATGVMQSPFAGLLTVNPTTGVVTISNAGPAGIFTVTVTAIDNCGAITNKSFALVVNGPPIITGQTITRQQGELATVSTIAIVSDDLTAPSSLSVMVTSVPAGITVGPLTNTNGTITANVAVACNATTGNNFVGLQVADGGGLTVTANQTVNVTANPVPGVTITGPASGSIYAVGTPINFNGTFTDNAGDMHTATWMFDTISQSAPVVEPMGSTPGSANTTYTFTTPGVYLVRLTVNDICGGTSTATTVGDFDAMVVIYDPNGGFVTGGGWINSPAGAYVPNPSLTGKANFGFVLKYHNGASVPTGNTEFQFKAGNLNFKSTAYEWLVVAGKKAQYKGSGTINGSGDYRLIYADGD